jgi:hypothetical protein
MKKIELVCLGDLARMMGKPIMDVFEIAKDGQAIWTEPKDKNIYINLQKFEQALDNEIKEELKRINK